MGIRFKRTVIKQKLNNETKQVTQTVEQTSETFESKLAKAKEFLNKRGIKEIRGVYGAPI